MNSQIMTSVLFIVALALTGFGTLTIPFIIEDRRAFHYGAVVRAQVKNYKKTKENGKTRTSLIWFYTYQGKKHLYCSKKSQRDETRKPGDWGALVIRKDNPSKVYEFMTPKEKIMIRTIGAILIIVSVIALCIVSICN